MATRLYQTSTAPVAPTSPSGWEVTANKGDFGGSTSTADYSSVAGNAPATVGSGVANDDVLSHRIIYGPVAAMTLSGTVKGQYGAREASALSDARPQMRVWVCAPDLTTNRGTALDFDTSALAHEFAVSAGARTNAHFPLGTAGTAATLSSVTVQAGDYIVVELGFRNHGTNTGVVRLRNSDDTGDTTDAPEDESTSIIDGGIYRGWVEFSASILLTTLSTPTTASLSLTTFAPTVTVATANPAPSPTTLALVLTTFAPTVGVSATVTPSTIALTLAIFAPSVTVAAIPAPSVEARIGWRPDQFNHVTNPGFETNTTGWSVSADINGAATSITRITTDFHSGAACGRLICPATALTGVNYNFGSQPFYAVATYTSVYRFVVWLKSESGTTQARLIVGSIGTSSDRASRDVTLTTDWQPFYLDWAPTGTRTDVELAIVNIPAVAMTVRIDDVSFFLRDALTQVENGYFTTDTSGWSVTASINAAGTSITRQSSGGYYGAACGRLVTTATSGSGMNWLLGTVKFTQGRTYRLRVWLKSVSGTTSARIRLGSIGTAADRGDSSVTITTTWTAYTVDWTPAADRTDAALAITNGTAAIMTADNDGIEVYEALDDISADAFGVNGAENLTYGRGASFDGSGQANGFANLTVYNALTSGKYSPENSSGSLYGLLTVGRRVLIRAKYSGVPYALFYGTVRRFVPNPMSLTCEIRCEDPLNDLSRIRWHRFIHAYPAHDSRTHALTQSTIYNLSSETGPIERLLVWRGTDFTSVLDFLNALNVATGTLHFVQPSVYASVGWQIVARGRTVHSDATTSSETWSDDLSDLSGYDVTDEALINHQRVGVTGYEEGVSRIIASAYQPEAHSLIDDVDGRFYFDDASLSGDLPLDQMPLTVPANTVRVLRFAFSPSVENPAFSVTYTSGSATETTDTAPGWATLTLVAGSADAVIQAIVLTGTILSPLPLNAEEWSDEEAIYLDGEHAPSDVGSPFVNHPAHAYGLARWKVWRWKRGRARPAIVRHNLYASQLSRDVSDRVTVTFARLNVSSKVYAIQNFTTSVAQNARDWRTTYQVEELPAAPSGGWFTLDSSALDGTATLAY